MATRTEDMSGVKLLAEIFGLSEESVEAMEAPRRAREADGWSLDRDHRIARMYWGPGPLPHLSHFEGYVRRPDGRSGALIQMHGTGIYVIGAGGCLSSVDQSAIRDLLCRTV